MIRKGIALIVMLLFVGMIIIPSCGTICKNSESLDTHKEIEYQPRPSLKLDLYPTDDTHTQVITIQMKIMALLKIFG